MSENPEDAEAVAASQAYEETYPMIEAAIALAIEGGTCGIVVDYYRRYACQDTRVPPGRTLDVTECGIEGVEWDRIDWTRRVEG